MSKNTRAENQTLAQRLWDARIHGKAIAPLGKEFPSLDATQAYEVLWNGIRLREDQGEQVVAYKMGLTSRAKREQMNLKDPIYGVLTDKMEYDSQHPFDLQGHIHPKAEPEIAFHVSRAFNTVPTPEEAFENCDLIAPAIEILDSRYEGFKYFSLPDVIADNGSSSSYLIGEPKRRDLFTDWRTLAEIKMDFLIDGTPTHHALSSEISGNPLLSVVALCELFINQGRTVPANVWILAGAATPAVALKSGMEVTLKTNTFSTTSFHVK
jgi:2-oxo-3-hexenedioate decarboxylase